MARGAVVELCPIAQTQKAATQTPFVARRTVVELCSTAHRKIPKAAIRTHFVEKSGCYLGVFKAFFEKHLNIRIVLDDLSPV